VKRRANGEGGVYKRKDGRWEGRVSLGDGSRKSLFGKTQREILDKLRALRKSQELLRWADGRRNCGLSARVPASRSLDADPVLRRSGRLASGRRQGVPQRHLRLDRCG